MCSRNLFFFPVRPTAGREGKKERPEAFSQSQCFKTPDGVLNTPHFLSSPNMYVQSGRCQQLFYVYRSNPPSRIPEKAPPRPQQRHIPVPARHAVQQQLRGGCHYYRNRPTFSSISHCHCHSHIHTLTSHKHTPLLKHPLINTSTSSPTPAPIKPTTHPPMIPPCPTQPKPRRTFDPHAFTMLRPHHTVSPQDQHHSFFSAFFTSNHLGWFTCLALQHMSFYSNTNTTSSPLSFRPNLLPLCTRIRSCSRQFHLSLFRSISNPLDT